MKNKVIVIIICLTLVCIALGVYFGFFYKKSEEVVNRRYFECTLVQSDTDELTVIDNIHIGFKNDELKEFTYRQIFNFKTEEKYMEYDNIEPNWPSYLSIYEKDFDNLTITYYRDIYFKYKNEGIDNYISNVESKHYDCVELNN